MRALTHLHPWEVLIGLRLCPRPITQALRGFYPIVRPLSFKLSAFTSSGQVNVRLRHGFIDYQLFMVFQNVMMQLKYAVVCVYVRYK